MSFTPHGNGRGEVTVTMLQEMLSDLVSEIGEDEAGKMVVRMMTQENWPFEYAISGHILSEKLAVDAETGAKECTTCGGYVKESWIRVGDIEGDECECQEPGRPTPVLYLVEGSQLGYGTKQAFEDKERFGW